MVETRPGPVEPFILAGWPGGTGRRGAESEVHLVDFLLWRSARLGQDMGLCLFSEGTLLEVTLNEN